MKETNAFISSPSPTPLSPSALGAPAPAEDLEPLTKVPSFLMNLVQALKEIGPNI
jgi:hypothetical protein